MPIEWDQSPRAVRTFVGGGEAGDVPIRRKYYGSTALIDRCVVTLMSNRALLLVGEPGTAKTMLSELLSAAICGTSQNTVQGSAGTTEDHIKYSWNYALLLAEGPSKKALVPSPVYRALERGQLVRFEEITRCPPEIQDALISVLSDKVMQVPELWDHLFEEGGRGLDPDALRWRVAVWCALARLDHSEEALEADGTLARERAMARHIRAALEAHDGTILAVTGGFHTAGLPAPVDAPDRADPKPVGASEHFLVPYGFAQLDGLHGYAAGMPAPAFYQRAWERNDVDDPMATAAELLVDIGRRTRDAGLGWSASPADELFGTWDDDTFLRAVPELRLAFAALTPREIDRVADALGRLGGEPLGELVLTDVDEHELPFNTRVQLDVRASLVADGLRSAS